MADVKIVPVALGERSYEIVIGERLLAKTGNLLLPLLKDRFVIIVTDETVARLYLHRLTNALEEQQIRCRTFIVKPGEASKSLGSFCELIEQLLEQQPDRNTTLLALGGGVVGDLTGFAASVLLRGVPFVQLPTTLLAQVDSSVGGKTGINSRFGKNLIGSFYQPALVLSDTATLTTLPKRQLLAGYAEILKYALINNPDFFNWLETHAQDLLAGDMALMQQAIVTSCRAKAAIVCADEKEAGMRALLNFGHTFAHALETETGYSDELLHGEAVAIGMILACKLSVAMKLCPQEALDRVLAHYQKTSLAASPRNIRPQWDVGALMDHFRHDKKSQGGKLTFVLTRGIGKAIITQDIDESALKQLLAQECAAM